MFFRFINLPAWLVLGGWIGLQFAAAPQAFQGTGSGVAYMAHIGGFIAGVALIPFFKKPTYPCLIEDSRQKHGRASPSVFQK